MKTFNGKALYNPRGKAGEYSNWACNFHVGCSNGCEYCYCKKGILATAMGQDEPRLKKCFKDEEHALEVFEKELKQNLSELRKHGLFFSFSTDPMLRETIKLTARAVRVCLINDVPVKILTKETRFVKFKNLFFDYLSPLSDHLKSTIAFGFTLTGHDELEPNASTNAERIEAMRELHNAGFKTWASIEPIIDFASSLDVFHRTTDFCDVYKIGLMSGKKYDKDATILFVKWCNSDCPDGVKIYFKDSLLKQAGINRKELPSNCVNRDYNIFDGKIKKHDNDYR